MIYRRFGRTELQMPVLSCGGMRCQQGDMDLDLSTLDQERHANHEAVLRRALELGVNHYETARGYGSSELEMGLVLAKLPREQFLLQTKISPKEDPRVFVDEVNDSIKRLQVDALDLLTLHGVNNREMMKCALRPRGCLEEARKLQRQGKTRFVGFSTHAVLDEILETIDHDRDGGFDYVNLHWYYIFQHNWPAIQAAQRRDMGVFIISPSDKGGRLYDPPDRLVELCKPLHPIVFNDLFCLSRPQVHTLSVGAAKPEEFDLHVEAVDQLDRADEQAGPIAARLEQAMRGAVEPEFADPFGMGLPRWQQMPGEVNVQMLVWLHHLATAWDMIDYGKMRYNLLGRGGHWFPGQTAQGVDDDVLREALSHVDAADKIIEVLRRADAMLADAPVDRLTNQGNR